MPELRCYWSIYGGALHGKEAALKSLKIWRHDENDVGPVDAVSKDLSEFVGRFTEVAYSYTFSSGFGSSSEPTGPSRRGVRLRKTS